MHLLNPALRRRFVPALGALVVMWSTAGCDDTGSVTRLADASFVETGVNAESAADGSTEGSAAVGCVLPAPADCEGSSGTICCASGERCVPRLGGTSVCLPAGDLAIGEICGVDGVDGCGVDALCADDGTGTLRCLQVCTPEVPECGDGATCSGALTIGSRTFSTCTRP